MAPITVSRVFNNSGYVRRETREKAIKTIEKLRQLAREYIINDSDGINKGLINRWF